MTATKQAVVIGGGISGLTAAWRLQQRAAAQGQALAITVCEADQRWGGVLRSQRRDDWVLEEGPDSFIRIKPAGLELVRDLGLEDELIPTSESARRSLIVRGKRLVPVPEGLYLMAPGKFLPFALSPIMSWRGKLRMGLDLVLPRRPSDAPEESLAAFVRRRLGREALSRLAQPMVGGIYTADPERLSLAATMPQFLEMEQEHRSLLLAMRARNKAQAAAAAQASGPRYGLFTTLRGGLDGLIEALRERLQAAGVSLRSGCPVERLERDESGAWRVATATGAMTADQVIIAAPAHVAGRVLAAAEPALAAELAGIPYAGVATVNIGLRREQVPDLPAAAGFVVPAIEHRSIVACTIASSKFAGRAPDGRVLLRAFVGGALHADDLAGSDEAIGQRAWLDLRERLQIRGEPELLTVHRWSNAMAQPIIGHGDRVAKIRAAEAAVAGLGLVGNGYEGVGIPDLAAQAKSVVERLLPA